MSTDIPLKEVTHTIQGHEIRLRIPDDPESVLATAVDSIADGPGASDPYWCLVWDAAPRTAELLLRRNWPAGQTAIEIGCGVGLTGIAAYHANLEVTLSDYSPGAVDNAISNARLNGLNEIQGAVIDWKDPPRQTRYDLIIGSDILYERSNHALVLNTCEALMKPGGACWIGDMGRAALPHFVELAEKSGWKVQLCDEDGKSHETVAAQRFQLLTLTR